MVINQKVCCPRCDKYKMVRCTATKHLSRGGIRCSYYCARCKKYFSGQKYATLADMREAIKNEEEKGVILKGAGSEQGI